MNSALKLLLTIAVMSVEIVAMEKVADKQPAHITLKEACDTMAPRFDALVLGDAQKAARYKRLFALRAARISMRNNLEVCMFGSESTITIDQFEAIVASIIPKPTNTQHENVSNNSASTGAQASVDNKTIIEKLKAEQQKAKDILLKIAQLDAKNEADQSLIASFPNKHELFNQLAQFFKIIHKKNHLGATYDAYCDAQKLQQSLISMCPELINLINKAQDFGLVRLINGVLIQLMKVNPVLVKATQESATAATGTQGKHVPNNAMKLPEIIQKRIDKVLKSIEDTLRWGLALSLIDPNRVALLESFESKKRNFSAFALKLETNYFSLPKAEEGAFKQVFDGAYIEKNILCNKKLIDDIIKVCNLIAYAQRDKESQKHEDAQRLEIILASVAKIFKLDE